MRFKTKEKLARKLLKAILQPSQENIGIMRFLIYSICSIISLETVEMIINEWIQLEEEFNPEDKIIQ